MDKTDDIIVLTDDDGNDYNCEFLDQFTFNGQHYVALLPESLCGESVIFLKLDLTADSDEEVLMELESDEEMDAVFEVFKIRNKDSFDFID